MSKSKIIASVIVVIFIALAIHTLATQRNKIELQQIEIQSTSSNLKELKLKYDTVNTELDKAIEDKDTSAEKVKQLEEERKKLEEEKQKLQADLQAKLDRQAELNKAAATVANAVTNTSTASASSGASTSNRDLMAQAGISPGDYQYADFIISHESSWSHTVWNTSGSGAYGLCQSMPASKMASMGSDYMTNPVTQLKWCDWYAKTRYGGWSQAYSAWVSKHWW